MENRKIERHMGHEEKEGLMHQCTGWRGIDHS